MFGLGTFGTLTFGQSPGVINVFFVNVAEAASAADATSSLATFASSIAEAASAVDASAASVVFSANIFETGNLIAVATGNTVYPVAILESASAVDDPTEGGSGVFGEFHLSGEATLEFVGTTRFVDMIEQGEAEIGIAAEIRVRSL